MIYTLLLAVSVLSIFSIVIRAQKRAVSTADKTDDSSVETVPRLSILSREILTLLRQNGSLKARRMAYLISQKTGHSITRREINRKCYYELTDLIYKDPSHCWHLG